MSSLWASATDSASAQRTDCKNLGKAAGMLVRYSRQRQMRAASSSLKSCRGSSWAICNSLHA